MRAFGAPALVVAFVAALAAVVVSAAGLVCHRSTWVDAGRWFLTASTSATTVAVVVLAVALVRQDYGLVYVADHTSAATAWPYRLAAIWGGMAGSLLVWSWMLGAWALVVATSVRRRLAELAAVVQGVLSAELALFVGLLVVVSRPFDALAVPAIDGGGLTPVLRHPAMLYHPPLLYAGAVVLGVPFALALAGRMAGSPVARWAPTARRFALAGVLLLGVGMLAGAHWAYVELGWGGYWAWDPVENGALLPWLAAVGFVHAAGESSRRGQAEGWAGGRASSGPGERRLTAMAGATFGLGLLGAYLTRSGSTGSVHAFAEARPVGRVLLVAVVMVALAVVTLGRRRVGDGASSPPAEEVSPAPPVDEPSGPRSSGAVIDTVLGALVVVVGFGTLWPVVAAAAGEGRAVVSGRFFAVATAPLALLLVAAIGWAFGPRSDDGPARRTRLVRPLAVGVAVALVTRFGLGLSRPTTVAMLGLGAAVLVVLGTAARRRADRRSAGALLAHAGVVVLLMGAAGTASGTQATVTLTPGSVTVVGGYRLSLVSVTPVPAVDGVRAARAVVRVERAGRPLAVLRPETLQSAQGERVSVAALRSTPREDLQVALRAVTGGARAAVLEVFVAPLAVWVWWGGVTAGAGLVLALLGRQPSAGSPPGSGSAAPESVASPRLRRSSRSTVAP